MAAAFAIMTAGVVGEADAMFAPYQGDASGGFGITVLLATLFLLLAVVAGPLLAFNMVLGDWTAERVRRAVDGRAASPETGKTDTEG